MAIQFKCDCGATCSADESEVGGLFRCEACGLDIPVPLPEDAAKADERAAESRAPPGTDLAETAVHDMEDAEARAAAEREMVEQIKEVRGDPAAEAVRHREDLAALKRETAGETDEADTKAKHDGDVQALYEQLGSEGGIAEMARELRTVRDGEAPVAVSAEELGPRTVRPVSRRLPKGEERAAHHIGIKRAIWLPSLIVGVICVAFGLCAIALRIHPRDFYKFFTGNVDPYAEHLTGFQEELKKAGIEGFEIVRVEGKAWAIPKGAEYRASPSGQVFYENASGYEDRAVPADYYAQVQSQKADKSATIGWFGIGLLVVGAVLVVLSIVTYRDVRIVAGMKAEEGETPEEADEEAAAEEAEADDDETPAQQDASEEPPDHDQPEEAEPDDEEKN